MYKSKSPELSLKHLLTWNSRVHESEPTWKQADEEVGEEDEEAEEEGELSWLKKREKFPSY